MRPIPEEPVSPELVLVDPVLRERLLRESLHELLYERVEPPRPRHHAPAAPVEQPVAPAAPPPGRPARPTRAPRRARTRLPSVLTAGALAALFLALPSLAFLPPRQAPRLVTADPATAVTWTIDPDADYYLLEVLAGGRLVRVAHPVSPPVPVDSLAPGSYTWRVFSGYGAVADANTRGPIEAGTLVVEASTAQS